jgi:hypothetical protein
MHSLLGGIRSAINLGRAARQELGVRARSLVLNAFTWKQNVGAVLNRFDQILEQQRRESGRMSEHKSGHSWS